MCQYIEILALCIPSYIRELVDSLHWLCTVSAHIFFGYTYLPSWKLIVAYLTTRCLATSHYIDTKLVGVILVQPVMVSFCHLYGHAN